MSENDSRSLAGTASDGIQPPKLPDQPQELRPVQLDKNKGYGLDFRAQDENQLPPKDFSVRASATMPSSVTGLEDVSEESSEQPALTSVEKDSSNKTQKVTALGRQRS